MTTTRQTIQDLRESLAGAQQHHRSLVAESREMPDRIRETSRRAAREKAASARQGQTGKELLAVGAEADLEELRAREQALPLEVWAQQLVVQEIERDLLRAQLEEAEAEMLKTGPEYERTRRELALAETAHGDAYAAHSGASNRAQGLRIKLRDSQKAISALENDSPGA